MARLLTPTRRISPKFASTSIHETQSYLSECDIPLQYCFELGINLKRIEVIADDEDEMYVISTARALHPHLEPCVIPHSAEASRRMVKNYDFVISSGGIGESKSGISITKEP